MAEMSKHDCYKSYAYFDIREIHRVMTQANGEAPLDLNMHDETSV